MLSFENYEELKRYLSEEILVTNEASKYLNISSQRLHQLVQSGKITPIKSTRSGSLFLKRDLEDRKKELSKHTDLCSFNEYIVNKFTDCDPVIVQESINYFSVQALFNNSDKKTLPFYESLNLELDLTKSITSYSKEVAKLLNVTEEELIDSYNKVLRGYDLLDKADLIVKKGNDYYPKLLSKTDTAPMFLFMRGNPNLTNYYTVSVVGTRNPSEDGKHKSSKLSELLGKHRIVVASGLAKGIDTFAHKSALKHGKPTIAVIGTPINKYYPKENKNLQKEIEKKGLVISQFPPSSSVQRWNFPLRNSVMSGISLATVIVEAGETSGSLIQADYALKQKRIVFIPNSALENKNLKWPRKLINKPGASKFSNISELIHELEKREDILAEQSIKNEQIPLFSGEVGIHYVSGD